jgi:hypothetical protein
MGVLKPPFNTMKIIYYNKIKDMALKMPRSFRQLLLHEMSKSLLDDKINAKNIL